MNRRDHIPFFHDIGGDIHFSAVDGEEPVAHQLPGGVSGTGQSHPVNHVVESHFQQLQEVFPGHPLPTVRDFEIFPELLFQNAVDAAHFLFFPQLNAVFGKLGPALPVLAGGVRPFIDGAFGRFAPLRFQEQFFAFSPAQPAY